MKSKKPVTPFTPHEIGWFIAPLSMGSIFFMAAITLVGILGEVARPALILYGVLGLFHTLYFSDRIKKSPNFREKYGWVFAITSGVGLGIMIYILPERIIEIYHILGVIVILTLVTSVDRLRAGVALVLFTSIIIPKSLQLFPNIQTILEFLSPAVIAFVAIETYSRIRQTTQHHISRLETINKVSRQLMQSLDKDQVLTLLDATIQDMLEADSFFIGILQGNEIQLDLFYDDNEYFNGVRTPLKGTLAGWIIRNQKELFLPDLREDVELDGVEGIRVIGKERTSLSWIGVPLKAENITGVMVLASYKPNDFDLADLELLSNLAQHVTLALDNTIRHAQVEEQARLDSLTGVYNHGYFLKKLAEQASEMKMNNSMLSLIMLDIDYFKQYNDTYGHIAGDNILNALCTAVRQHIKQFDAVGRWGGEEFIISLPNATGEQAAQVAKRISETMATLQVQDQDKQRIPVPTISQGIAVFPHETDDIYRLIDMADKRLYIAKERGRNQIEPEASHWSKIKIIKE